MERVKGKRGRRRRKKGDIEKGGRLKNVGGFVVEVDGVEL